MFVDCIQHRRGSWASLYTEAINHEEPLSIPQPYSRTAVDPLAIISGVCRSSVHHLRTTKSDIIIRQVTYLPMKKGVRLAHC